MKKLKTSISIIFLVAVSLLPDICQGKSENHNGDKLHLWEFGVVGVAARLPHYRGSDEYKNYTFPLPYFIYRGEKIKADREGVRGIFWRNKRFESDISLSGNPPVSDDNKARTGMTELDSLIEIGPALRYYFYEIDDRNSLFLQSNLRMAFTMNFDSGIDTEYQGYISDLSLVYKNSKTFIQEKIHFHFSIGVQYADTDLHSYFYDVASEYVTPEREYYKAESGYGGVQVSGSFMKELTDSISIGLYSRWINCNGAAYEKSPLVQTANNYIVGCLLLWKLSESETLQK